MIRDVVLVTYCRLDPMTACSLKLGTGKSRCCQDKNALSSAGGLGYYCKRKSGKDDCSMENKDLMKELTPTKAMSLWFLDLKRAGRIQ